MLLIIDENVSLEKFQKILDTQGVYSVTKIFYRDGYVQKRKNHDFAQLALLSIIFLTRHNTVSRSQRFIGQDKSLRLSLMEAVKH